jgi:hypothetical protein
LLGLLWQAEIGFANVFHQSNEHLAPTPERTDSDTALQFSSHDLIRLRFSSQLAWDFFQRGMLRDKRRTSA